MKEKESKNRGEADGCSQDSETKTNVLGVKGVQILLSKVFVFIH